MLLSPAWGVHYSLPGRTDVVSSLAGARRGGGGALLPTGSVHAAMSAIVPGAGRVRVGWRRFVQIVVLGPRGVGGQG